MTTFDTCTQSSDDIEANKCSCCGMFEKEASFINGFSKNKERQGAPSALKLVLLDVRLKIRKRKTDAHQLELNLRSSVVLLSNAWWYFAERCWLCLFSWFLGLCHLPLFVLYRYLTRVLDRCKLHRHSIAAIFHTLPNMVRYGLWSREREREGE